MIARTLARIALVLIALAALSVMWLIRIHVLSTVWPFYSHHHPRLLVFLLSIVCWILAGALALLVAYGVLKVLWEKADLA